MPLPGPAHLARGGAGAGTGVRVAGSIPVSSTMDTNEDNERIAVGNCSQCGQPVLAPKGLTVPAGSDIRHAEGQCPTDQPVEKRAYRATIMVERITVIGDRTTEPGEYDEIVDDERGMTGIDRLTEISTEIEAATFMMAVPALGPKIAEQWDKVVQFAAIAEAD